MPITHRAILHDADKLQMYRLACQFPGTNFHTVDLPWRFSSWALDEPENTRLWLDGSQGDDPLLAWAVLQSPWFTIDSACLPDAEPALHPHILAWADRRIREVHGTRFACSTWYVNVFADQRGRIRDLETAGFSNQADVGEDSWSKVLMQRPGSLPVRLYNPPTGYTVRSLAGEDEVQAYVDLHPVVFDSKAMTIDWRSRTLQQPAYRPDLDVVVETPDGHLAAFCIGWLSEDGYAGQIEPLGCHQDFRRYALGRVALSAVLQRLQAAGAQHVYMETDSYRNTAFRLYESFDFQIVRDVLVYRKG